MSGYNINYVEDHGEDYDPNMEEFVATNEWQQVKHGKDCAHNYVTLITHSLFNLCREQV